MTTYAIGDVQGCYAELQLLLTKIAFDPSRDRLWFTGDLVNRGPDSLATLRFLSQLQPAPVVVLGNHDLHLLAVAAGVAALKPGDTFGDILQAPDKSALCQWLRQQPLLHHDPDLGYTLIHAGLAPQWDLALSRQCAHEVETVLRDEQRYLDFLQQMYGNKPTHWTPQLAGWDRLRFITNCLTRLRFCDSDGNLSLKEKSSPNPETQALIPWFAVPWRAHANVTVIFGHWAALNGRSEQANTHALDTGCVWGNKLTAMRLCDQKRFSVPALQTRRT